MHPCPLCACHVHNADAICPHCGARLGIGRNTLSAVLLSLTIAACTGGSATTKSTIDDTSTSSGTTVFEPPYGITTMGDADTDADSDSDLDTDTDVDVTGGTGSTGTGETGGTGAR